MKKTVIFANILLCSFALKAEVTLDMPSTKTSSKNNIPPTEEEIEQNEYGYAWNIEDYIPSASAVYQSITTLPRTSKTKAASALHYFSKEDIRQTLSKQMGIDKIKIKNSSEKPVAIIAITKNDADQFESEAYLIDAGAILELNNKALATLDLYGYYYVEPSAAAKTVLYGALREISTYRIESRDDLEKSVPIAIRNQFFRPRESGGVTKLPANSVAKLRYRQIVNLLYKIPASNLINQPDMNTITITVNDSEFGHHMVGGFTLTGMYHVDVQRSKENKPKKESISAINFPSRKKGKK